jgi:hypothetical protein
LVAYSYRAAAPRLGNGKFAMQYLRAQAAIGEDETAADDAGAIRDSYIDNGQEIDEVSVHAVITGIVRNADAVEVTTTRTTTIESIDEITGEVVPSSFTDTHLLTLTEVGGQYFVAADQNVAAPLAPLDRFAPKASPLQVSEDERPFVTTGSASGTSAAFDAQPVALTVSPSVAHTANGTDQGKINTTKFAAYAKKWTASPYHGDDPKHNNSAYPYASPGCTNFASQVLNNSGWSLRKGNSLQVYSTSVWTTDLAGVAKASRTWTAASYLYGYAKNQTKAYQHLDNIWNASIGDLLFTDWDPNGKADGSIDHVMVVTGRDSSGPRISQKSTNRNNVLLDTSITLAKQQGKSKIVWYGLKHK